MQRYPILIEKGERNYSAYSPDVPGCVATAATRRELEHRMQEALALHVESLRTAGEAVPEPSLAVAYVEV